MLRKMRSGDVDRLVDIHLSSWNPSEISVKLGKRYLLYFYRHVIDSPHSFCYVSTEDEKIIAYATGFYDYRSFNVSLKKKIFLKLCILMLVRLIQFRLKLADIHNLFNDNKKLRNAKYPLYHLGALALDNDYKGTQSGKKAIKESITAVLEEFKGLNLPGCWGLCDEVNIPMRKYLLKLGFKEVDVIPLTGKSVVLYEISFDGR